MMNRKTLEIKNILRPMPVLLMSLAAFAGLPAYSDVGAHKMVKMITSLGEIEIELAVEEAPITVRNFVEYVESGFYDGTVFHRVIPGFVVQGGGFTAGMQKKQTNPAIVNEADNGLKNKTGTLSMARTSDPDSATSQFFINLADNAFLDFSARTRQKWGYAVFARVTGGMEVVEKMAEVPTGGVAGHSDVPLQPIVIEKAEMIEN